MSDDEDAVLLCNRVADMPIPSVLGEIRHCTGGCLERVWVAFSSPKHARPVCVQCAQKMIDEEEGDPAIEPLTPAQIADVLRWRKGRRR